MPDSPLPPGSTIGILGGGQLGRMLAVAAARLGLKTHIYADETDAPAFDVAAAQSVGSYADADAIARFAKSVDVVTCEFENVPAAALEAAAAAVPVFPQAKSFAIAQDRLAEKDFVTGLGIAVAPYAPVGSREDLVSGLARVGLPALLKTRRLGYDGKGQVPIRTGQDASAAFASLGAVPALVEGIVPFEREISVIVVRGQRGEMQFYDPVENTHQGGILATSRAPARIAPALSVEARTIAGKIVEALSHVGVICVEMFARSGGRPELRVNEFAPRVHNSGHWTLDACITSQFENHVRAISGWPLGETARHSNALMTNLIGADIEKWRELAAEPDTAVHLYGKAQAREGRKMGHVTRLYPKS
ncbi:MAG TPA: 5-(carboxyamino)imidazole ribonucleotide synthase [Methyloceanibacter sp.]|nr:5-(carboxyamino)imidazole ribonucleotide synthase [Methyloceanibacter sp.]